MNWNFSKIFHKCPFYKPTGEKAAQKCPDIVNFIILKLPAIALSDEILKVFALMTMKQIYDC
jgi:hypothetical protein